MSCVSMMEASSVETNCSVFGVLPVVGATVNPFTSYNQLNYERMGYESSGIRGKTVNMALWIGLVCPSTTPARHRIQTCGMS